MNFVKSQNILSFIESAETLKHKHLPPPSSYLNIRIKQKDELTP